jgi:hypothetical protein
VHLFDERVLPRPDDWPPHLVVSGYRECSSHRAIVAELAIRGLVSRSRRPFAKTQITRMLAKAAA